MYNNRTIFNTHRTSAYQIYMLKAKTVNTTSTINYQFTANGSTK